MVTCSPKSAFTEGPLPGYGMKVMSTFAMRLSFSNPRWNGLPGPMLAMVKLPGVARAAASRSASEWYGEAAVTTMRVGAFANWQMGSKLVSGS